MDFIGNISKIKTDLDRSFEELEQNVNKENIENTKHNVDKLIEYFVAFSQDLLSNLKETEEQLKLKTDNCVDKQELEKCEHKIKELQHRIQESDKVLTESDDECSNIEKNRKKLEIENVQLTKKIEKITKECEEKREQTELPSKKCTDLEKKIKEIQIELEETKSELQSVPDCDIHISKLKLLEEKNKEILNDIVTLQQNIQEIEEINKGLNITNVKIENEKSELIRQLKDITDEIEEQRLTIAKHMDKIEEQKSQSLHHELGLVGKNLECQQLRDEINKYVDKNKKLERDLNVLGERLKTSVDKSKTIIRDTQKML